jgi:hypothetical protein
MNSMYTTNYTCKFLCDSCTCSRLESEVNAWRDVQQTGIGMRTTLESPQFSVTSVQCLAFGGLHCTDSLIVQQKIVKHCIELSVLRLRKILPRG